MQDNNINQEDDTLADLGKKNDVSNSDNPNILSPEDSQTDSHDITHDKIANQNDMASNIDQSHKKSPLFLILIIVLILVAVGVGIWWYVTQYQSTSNQEPVILYTAESVNKIPPLPSETSTLLP